MPMRVITDEEHYKRVWDRIYKEFSFCPSVDTQITPFQFKMDYRTYKLSQFRWEQAEGLIEQILRSISNQEIYALDWQHDAFLYLPGENRGTEWYDDARMCNVYFPSYYPDGDYYFFIAQDFSYGIFGHPWRKELYFFGEKLIAEFEKCEDQLLI